MHSLSLVLGFLASITPALAGILPSVVPFHKYGGPVKPGSYLVKVRDGVDPTGIMNTLTTVAGGNNKVTYQWNNFYNAFAGNFDDDGLNILLSSLDVEYVTEDGIMSTSVTQTDASWNLARISTRDKLADQDAFALTDSYSYLSQAGEGVDIYVVDTGIYVEHPDFEGRARWGGAFCQGCAQQDGLGHGTHVAGTAGGKRSGVAKKVNLIAVKVLADNGTGSVSEIIDGLVWVYEQYRSSNRPSIATMSFGGSPAPLLDLVVASLVASGVHCTVAAGNSNTDAATTSPAQVPLAITVGATDITDSRAFYSNYGSIVDIFAPGSNVTSTWIDGGYRTISGTSMATPCVAGLVAYYLTTAGPAVQHPAAMSAFIQVRATKDKLSNIPAGTRNLLAFNGYGS